MSKRTTRQMQLDQLRKAHGAMGRPHLDPFSERGSWFNDFGHSDFDRTVKRGFGAVLAIWVFGVIATLAFWGVVIWAIIKLVNHFA